ncbi:MAG: hypothetical protein QXE79_05940 [Candidatus Bathyarchaeia archaeon]
MPRHARNSILHLARINIDIYIRKYGVDRRVDWGVEGCREA